MVNGCIGGCSKISLFSVCLLFMVQQGNCKSVLGRLFLNFINDWFWELSVSLTVVIDLQEEAVVLADQIILIVPPLGVGFFEMILILGDDGADEGNLTSPPILLTIFSTSPGDIRAQVVERLVLIFFNGISDPFSNWGCAAPSGLELNNTAVTLLA